MCRVRNTVVALALAAILPGTGRSDDTDAFRRRLEAQEARIRELQRELEETRTALVQAKLQADAAEHRCRKLIEALEAAQSGKVKVAAGRQDSAKSLPYVTGKVTEVGKDGRLVQVNIGTDVGLKVGQTLEVMRLGDAKRPTYLGTLKLTRVDPTVALGQFNGMTKAPAPGDTVATGLVPE